MRSTVADKTWTHKFEPEPRTVVVPAVVKCTQFPGEQHWWVDQQTGSVSVCHACAGHGTTAWGRLMSFGYFQAVARGAQLVEAYNRGFKAGWVTGVRDQIEDPL